MASGTACFAAGSLILLSVAGLRDYALFLCVALWYATGFFIIGWFKIGIALFAGDDVRPIESEAVGRAMRLTFAASVLGFMVAVSALPILFPGDGWFGPVWLSMLEFGVFLYVPAVYAPIFLGHAALHLLAVPFTLGRRGALCHITGSMGLAAIATAGLLFQFGSFSEAPDSRLVWALPGLAGPLYLLMMQGWRFEARALRDLVRFPPGDVGGRITRRDARPPRLACRRS